MRYCPNCRIDYDEEVDECALCGGPAVDGTSRETYEDISEEAWVELDPLPSLSHARSVVDALDEEKIPCYIEAIFSGSGSDGFSANIMIPDNSFEEAIHIQQGIAPPDDDDFLIDPDADDF